VRFGGKTVPLIFTVRALAIMEGADLDRHDRTPKMILIRSAIVRKISKKHRFQPAASNDVQVHEG
jgi:hypothetical protein